MSRILYIDFFNYFYSSFSTDKSVDGNGDPCGGFVGSVSRIQRAIDKFSPQRVIVVFDGPDAGMRRRQYFSEYKGRRTRKKRLSQVEMGEGEFVAVNNEEQQLKNAYSLLCQLPVTVVIVPFYEADDIIAYLTLKNPQHENIICSSDKDYIQLIDENTYVWSWGKKVLLEKANISEHFKVLPENFVYYRSIIGDSSDKLPGVKGVGDTTLLGLLPELGEKKFKDFKDFWNRIESLNEEDIEQTKLRNCLTKIKNDKENVALMYKLMDLGTGNLKLKAIEQTKQQLEEQETQKFSTIQFKLYCIKNSLEKAIRYFDFWVRPFASLKKSVSINV